MATQISQEDLRSYLNSGSFPSTPSKTSGQQVVDDIPSWVDVVSAEVAQSSEAGPKRDLRLQRLKLLKSTSELARGNKATIARLLAPDKRLAPNGAEIASRGQLVRYHYYNAGTSLQDAMFEAEPLGVLLAMIDEAQILEKADASLRKAAVRALETATGSDPLPISSLQFRASVEAPEFFDGIDKEKIGTDKSTPEDVVLETVKALQRLVYLVRDPDHLVSLFDENLRSAHDVASLGRSWFVERMVNKHGMKENAAKRIHDHSTNIDCRNQETWVRILSSLNNDFVVGVKRAPLAPSKQVAGSKGQPPKNPYNLTDMFNLQFNECERDCCSVTGATAYFQDLMKFLQNLPLESAPKDERVKASRTVLDALVSRRPDLVNLELSCANSTKKVAYTALVIEVLESYITSLQSRKDKDSLDKTFVVPVTAVNEFDGSTTSSTASGTKQAEVDSRSSAALWESGMASQLFPFQTFPYSLFRDTVETSLSSLDLSTKKLFALLGPSNRLLSLQDSRSSGAYRRAKACATLNLSQEDFFVITGQQVWNDPKAPGASRTQEAAWSGPAAHTIWGYGSPSAMLDADEAAESGLCFVQKQLLPRSGLSFDELVELLQTPYFGGRLVLVNKKEEKDYESSAISELRLRALHRYGSSDATESKAGSTDDVFISSLDSDLCTDLQAFLRLKVRGNWSIADLDSAISTISQRLVNGAHTGSPTISESSGISALVLEELATIVELSELVSKPVAALLPLWGDIHTRGPKSLYHKICFTAAADKTGDRVFHIPASRTHITATPLRDGGEIWKHKAVLQAVLRVSTEGLEDLRKATGLAGSRVLLSLRNLTILYRYQLLCDLLKIKPKALSDLRDTVPASFDDVFDSPAAALTFTRRWRGLLGGGQWTPEGLTRILAKKEGLANADIKNAAWDLAAGLCDIARQIDSEWLPKTSASAAPTPDNLDYICNLLLEGSPIAVQVSKLIQGTLEASAPAPPGFTSLPDGIPSRIRLDKALSDSGFRLTLHGLLSREEQKKTLILLEEDSEAALNIIHQLDSQSRDVLHALEQSRFYQETIAAAEVPNSADKLKQALAVDAYGAAAGLSAEQTAVEGERLRDVRGAAFCEFALPQLKRHLIQDSLADGVQAWSEKRLGNNKELAETLLKGLSTAETKAIASSLGLLKQPAAAAAKEDGAEGRTSELVLFPASVTAKTEVYLYLPLLGDDDMPNLKVDGISVTFEKLDGTDLLKAGPLHFNALEQSLDPKTRSSMQLDFESQESTASDKLSWSVSPDGTGAARLLASCSIIRSGDMDRLTALFMQIFKAITLVNKVKMSTLDVRVLLGASSLIELDISSLGLDDLAAISSWQTIAKEASAAAAAAAASRTPPGGGATTPDDTLFELLQALQLQSASPVTRERDLASLVARFSNIMGLSEAVTNQVFSERFKQLSPEHIFESLKGSSGLFELASLVGLIKGLAVFKDKVPVSLLFQIVSPDQATAAGGSQKVFEGAARGLQSCLGEAQRTKCQKEISGKKRRVLVDFLLQQEHIKTTLGIGSPDGLYEHLLIDVQMGPELETTRMKQAVSTIQLFVQRCLMGMESSRGVVSSDIRQKEWAWRQQHSVWQAARRVFLYPENWLEPSIRDDKTPIFRDYETRIQEQDLSWGSFVSSIKGYARDLADIADLDIQAYLRQSGPDSSDIFHLFGRTRNAPYLFFYRRMTANRSSVSITNPSASWSAWNRMELDTLTYETDWDGNTLPQSGTYMVPVMRRNRLFLFLPQITVKTATPKVTERTETIKGKDSKGKDTHTVVPATYDSISKEPIKNAAPQKYWEIRMAWTELCDDDGKWSPKRLSQTSLTVQANNKLSDSRALPSIGSFIFEVLPSSTVLTTGEGSSSTTTPDETVIRVGCWNAPDVSYYSLGSFSIKDDRIVATSNNKRQTDSLGSTLLTTFHKYSWSDTSKSEAPVAPPGLVRAGSDLAKQQLPLLAVPYGSTTETRKLTWTLSFGGDKSRDVTGMFVDDVRGNNNRRSATVFMWPTTADGIPAEFSSGTVVGQSQSVAMVHSHATRLVEAASGSSGSSGADDLFEKIQENPVNEAGVAALDFGSETNDKFAAGRHELTTPYAIYNWELGLHAVLLAVERFQATQQFDLALRAMKLIFDPTAQAAAVGKMEDAGSGSVAVECWKFPPFREVAAKKDKMRDGFSDWPDDLAPDSRSSDLSLAVAERRSNPLNAHGTARGRTQAYMKWVIFKYVEVLVCAGDVYFRRGSLEALPIAIQRYVEASYILGPAPQKVAKLGRRKAPLTFATFKEKVDLELEFPFLCALSRRGCASALKVDGREQSLLCMIKSDYFCLPPNPKYQHLRELVEDRFFKTRNNLDINGRPIAYSINEPYLDPAQLLSGNSGFASGGAGGVLDLLSGSQDAPVPYARFQVLIGRAMEMCGDVRSMMEQLLTVREKRDGEALALLRARQDVKKQDLLLGLKKLGYEELDSTLESLQVQRESNVTQLVHYLKLLGEDEEKVPRDAETEWEDVAYEIDEPTSDHLRMSPYEQIEFEQAQKAADLTEGSSIRDEIVAGLRMLPTISEQIQPMGMGVTMRIDSHLVADALEAKSKIDRIRALIATNKSQRAGRINGLTRQLHERALQANIKGREIKALDKQIAAQKKRLELNEKEQALQQREMEWSSEIQAWYQDKFSSEKLYAFMENQLRTIAYDVYQLALCLGRLAERAFLYERPNSSAMNTGSSSLMTGGGGGGVGAKPGTKFLRPEGYWQPGDNGGIFASQRLSMDLRRMQLAYIEKPSFDYQISKTVSLRQIDPIALTHLQETGTATFEVPELYFDVDFPGHYMRRLKSVAVSIPALIGPFTSIAASLTMTSHKYRITDIVKEKSEDGWLSSSSSGDAHASQFRTDQSPINAIAVSSGTQDSGIFDMTSVGEQLAPFEGAGVISRWRIELPKTSMRQFDYRTISDVVLHMKYTSLQGGPKLRQAAIDSVNNFVAGVKELGSSDDGGLLALFSLKADLSNEWYSLQGALRKRANAKTATDDAASPLKLSLGSLQGCMPFWTRGSAVNVHGVSLVVSYSEDISQQQAEEDGNLLKLVTSEHPDGFDWESTDVVGRSALLTKEDGLEETQLDQDWELHIVAPTTAKISNISLVIKYSLEKGGDSWVEVGRGSP